MSESSSTHPTVPSSYEAENQDGPETKKTVRQNRISATMLSVHQLRRELVDFFLLAGDPKLTNSQRSMLPPFVDVIVFGPSGSGKSSLIRTFYRALHNTSVLPRDLSERVVVQDTLRNEGTTQYVKAVIKQREQDTDGRPTSSGIILHDTRGQIWMDRKEQQQLDVIIQGRIKDDVTVEQRDRRYARLLWEFWRSEADLFPPEILNKRSGLATRPHALIFVFDGSMDEIPNGEEETDFYREVISMARRKGYYYPQIVLTRIDKVEQQLPQDVSQAEAEVILRQRLDSKIEAVVLNLGVSRSSVHFIENYHADGMCQDLSIDFHALRVLHECVQHGDTFIRSAMKNRPRCVIQ
ncbi:unnamed protein product [Vitrella brassicaformis CCMP3155]|uniref:G domain-containing protein n=1 Tax=Vitrella brassicaformis (strain CCMP3155) TaxID=1169540 RepID=A0A0G4EW44_VITBC|nr:unnamed protein product [Vitrella brassicaformis CCMP3155]|eukprot:CEM02672.1 unnamed protein product [Vitrella brassicaformis CCMP3155]